MGEMREERVAARAPHVQGRGRSATIVARGMSKTFAGRPALRDVALEVVPGEVHGLVGQNGSGKSTLIKILAGVYAPDDGATLFVHGREVSLPVRPGQAAELGMSFVHQDLGLIPSMTVLENFRVGQFQMGPAGRVRWRAERELTRTALARFGLEADPDARVDSLRDVDRAIIAIARAFQETEARAQGRSLLVLDEPTVYLPQDGLERLFAAVSSLRDAGAGVLFVTHRLEEILAHSDRVTVLRDGQCVETRETRSLDEETLIRLILGRDLDDLYPERHESGREIALRVRGLSGEVVDRVSFELHEGEILGLTGLAGMGYEEIPYLLVGAKAARGGEMERADRTYRVGELDPHSALRGGVALLPANRLRSGGVAGARVRENVTLPVLGRYVRGGRLRHREERRDVRQLLERFEVVPPEPERRFATLSGGNQQKALLAKWLQASPAIFLIHEPTQGVDVGSRKQIFSLIRAQADAGRSIVLATAEYEDLAHLCDRVLVFRHGRIVSELTSTALTRDRIVEQCFRQRPKLGENDLKGEVT